MDKENFLKGLICGIVLSIVLVFISFLIMRDRLAPQQPDVSYNAQYTEFENKVVEKVRTLRSYIDRYFLYEEDEDKMLNSICEGVMNSLGDPYSVYYDNEAYQKLMDSTAGVYYGIGVQVQQNIQTMQAVVVSVFKGSPAEEVGIKAGDIFLNVNGEDVTQKELNEIVTWIKGEAGTKIPITIYRPRDNKEYTFEVERRQVEIATVSGEMLEDAIGYIIIAEFDEVTPKQFKEEYEALKKQGMQGLIVDLRNNPGGLLSSVVEICDMFLGEGIVVYTEDKNGLRTDYSSDSKEEKIPMVVLVDGGSASASEIFAGAMKDYNRATLVGTKTYGKGIVQRFLPLPGDDKDAIKITISSYFTPSGVCIHGVGITPDVVEELDEAIYDLPEITKEDDNQLQKAIAEMKKKLR